MRNFVYIAIAMTIATVAGCQRYDESLNLQNNTHQIFYATFENSANTRTALDESNNVLWSDGDQISIFDGTDINNSYILKEGANSTYGVFEKNPAVTAEDGGSGLSANVAYYPYDNDITVLEENGSYTINATFPATQTYSESGTFGNGASPMVAVTSSTTDDNLKFKNVGAIFRLQLMGDAAITKIIFSANADLAGDCRITASNTSNPTVSVVEGSRSITLNCGEGVQLDNSTPTNFIVAMLPVENITGGMIITIYDNAGKKMVYSHKGSETVTIKRSKAYTTAVVTYIGDQAVIEDTASAQEALDNAVSGTTIQLEPGVNYGTLVFRESASSTVVDITYAGGDAAGNEKYRIIENLTIIGAEGAVVDAFDFQVGWIEGSGASYIDIKNLTVKGVSFSGEKTPFNFEGSKGSGLGIDGLNIVDCKMNDADGNNRFVFQQITGYKDFYDKTTNQHVMTAGIKNLTITGCEVTGAYQVIESRAMENLTITNNTFKNIKARDMLITSDTGSHPGVTYTGNITITGNSSTDGEERFIRASLNNSNAVVVIKNNTIIDYKGKDKDYIKVEGGNNVTIEDNTFVVGVSTTDDLEKLVLNAIDGSVFQLEAGNYGPLDFTHTYDGSKITAKNLTIKGVSGTVMSKLVSPEGGNDIINWTISDIVFDGTGSDHKGIDIRSGGKGLTVENCKFINGALIFVDNNYEGITIKKCDFKQSPTGGVYCQKVKDVAVDECKFEDMPYNAIQLSGQGVSGTVSITNNIISNCVSRAMRLVTVDGATLNISNNTMIDSSDNGEVIKITGAVCTGTFENNTHNGRPITFNDGIAREQ